MDTSQTAIQQRQGLSVLTPALHKRRQSGRQGIQLLVQLTCISGRAVAQAAAHAVFVQHHLVHGVGKHLALGAARHQAVDLAHDQQPSPGQGMPLDSICLGTARQRKWCECRSLLHSVWRTWGVHDWDLRSCLQLS